MITIRKSASRGHFDFGWLDTRHTFSFADYYDPDYMSFRKLRVINQDIVQPHKGFAPHQHDNMEIITYVIRGEITHKDSMGNQTVIRPNEIQRMSAGTGIMHSEYNRSDEILELLQIWILPDKINLTPSYQQIAFTPPHNNLLTHPLDIHQDVKIFTGCLDENQHLNYLMGKNRHVWIQLISGQININHIKLDTGDGAAMSNETSLEIEAHQKTHFLLFDLP